MAQSAAMAATSSAVTAGGLIPDLPVHSTHIKLTLVVDPPPRVAIVAAQRHKGRIVYSTTCKRISGATSSYRSCGRFFARTNT
jgi:hypothetical protein